MGRVQTIVPPELATLYHALEVDFQPLKLVQRVQPALDRIAEDSTLNAYLEPLHDVVVSKTLLQLSQVYRSLRFDELVRLCPFYDPLTLERCVIELIYNLELPMRVDHRRHAIIFDVYIDLGISQRDYSQCMQSAQVSDESKDSYRLTRISSIHRFLLFQTGGDQVSRQLTLFAQSLHQVAELLNVNESDSQARDIFVQEYMKTAEQHHHELLLRREHIESRKEQLEQIQEERARVL